MNESMPFLEVFLGVFGLALVILASPVWIEDFIQIFQTRKRFRLGALPPYFR